MAYAGAMRNGSTPRLVGMVSKVDEKTLCTESALNRLAPHGVVLELSSCVGVGAAKPLFSIEAMAFVNQP